MAESKKIHYNVTENELYLLKIIDNLIIKEVKTYNNLINSKIPLNKELNSLKGKEDDLSKKRSEELKKDIEILESTIKTTESKFKDGTTSKEILTKLKSLSQKNVTTNKENVLLFTYLRGESKVVEEKGESTNTEIIQFLIDKKLEFNRIKNTFYKKNLNYFTNI